MYSKHMNKFEAWRRAIQSMFDALRHCIWHCSETIKSETVHRGLAELRAEHKTKKLRNYYKPQTLVGNNPPFEAS